MITTEEKIIKIFYEIDEELKKLKHKSHKNSECSDSEILTIAISKELINKGTDKDYYLSIKDNYIYLFPNMPDYSKFIRRIKKLSKLMKELFDILFSKELENEYIDTMPIELIMGVREKRSKVSREFYKYGIKPDWGYCSSKKLKYFGFKLVAIYSNSLIKDFMLVPANTSEQGSLMKIVKTNNLNGFNMFGDKGFQMKEDDIIELKNRKINLEIPPRKNLKNPPKVDNLYQKIKNRRTIETAFSQLNDIFMINSFFVRSALGFTVSILRKIFAFNFYYKFLKLAS